MTENLIKSNATFCIRLDGENEIDANLLSKTINDMAELTKIAVKEENSEAYAKLNVTAFQNGSFQIDFSTIAEMLPTLMSDAQSGATLALTVVNTLGGIFLVKKHIGNKKPKNIEEKNDTIIIENENGDKITTPKSSVIIINNTTVDQLVTNISNYAQDHNPDGSLTFETETDKNTFTSDDLKTMSKALPIENVTTCQKTQTEVCLVIKKPDIRGKSSWDFYLPNNKRISACINDDDWIDRLHNREFTIGYGDSMSVILEQYIDLDLDGNPIENTEKYTVIKVKGDITTPSEQLTL